MVEFFCNIPSLKSLTSDVPKVTTWNSYELMNLMRSREGEEMQQIINHMGELSGIAQRLRGPITSVERLLQSFQKIYMLTSSVQGQPGHILAQGILKVGQKRLFIRKIGDQLVEMSPLCVLDFYVHESCQRQGLGHVMFETMLEQEMKRACQLGYDKPSNKLLSFMAKHYNLKNYNSQANQFVVYNDYFDFAKNDSLREKENCNVMPDIGTTLKKEKVIHGRRAANNHVADHVADSQQPARPESTASVLPPQPSFLRGRRNTWQLKQEHNAAPAADSGSPTKAASLPLRDAYRHEVEDKVQQQRRTDTACHRPTKPAAGASPPGTPPQFSIIGEAERVRIQSLCSPSLALKMNVGSAADNQFRKPLKPRIGAGATRIPGSGSSRSSSNSISSGNSISSNIKSLSSKEPPQTYPFWSEAKAQSSPHHWQERHPVDYSRTRTCC